MTNRSGLREAAGRPAAFSALCEAHAVEPAPMILKALSAALASLLIAGAASAATPVYTYQVVRTFPHDTGAFTEGLFYEDGLLWESTGLPGHSFVRKEQLDTGKVLEQHDLPARDF